MMRLFHLPFGARNLRRSGLGLLILALPFSARLCAADFQQNNQHRSSVAPGAGSAVAAESQKLTKAEPGAKGGLASEASTETVITATEHLFLDSKGYEATFLGDVKVLDSRFALNCKKLTAFLKRPAAKPGSESGTASEKKSAQAEDSQAGGGIEKAVAEGDVVIVQDKVNDKGVVDRSVGRGAKAVYDAGTGNITLTGWPQVEQKVNAVVATEEGTVIVLNSKGKMEVIGHSKTVLRNTSVDDRR